MKRLVFSVFAIALSAAISIGFLEWGVRLAYPAYDPSGHIRFEADAENNIALGPRNTTLRQIKNTGDFDVTITFNKFGLREDKDFSRSDINSVALVGDSLSFGWGVEENERLSEKLEDLSGLQVFNISIPVDIDGYDSLLVYARKIGLKFDRTIVCLSVESDIRDYHSTASSPPAEAATRDSLLKIVKTALSTHSALYFLFTSAVHGNETLRAFFLSIGLINPNLEGSLFAVHGAEKVESTVRRLAEFSAKNNAIALIAPSRGLWFGTPDQIAAARKEHRDIVEGLRESATPYVDLAEDFDASPTPLEMYFFKNDGHWNAAGHATAARALHRYFDKFDG